MITMRNRQLTISTLIMLMLSLANAAWAAEGLRGGGRDLFGSRYEDAPQTRASRRERNPGPDSA